MSAAEVVLIILFQQWYTAQIQLLCNFLSERLDHSLHLYQCTCLAHVVKARHETLDEAMTVAVETESTLDVERSRTLPTHTSCSDTLTNPPGMVVGLTLQDKGKLLQEQQKTLQAMTTAMQKLSTLSALRKRGDRRPLHSSFGRSTRCWACGENGHRRAQCPQGNSQRPV
uniref:CCHC-type domain-containing protein n=1 Tax=Timema douglasi TaxID=61478 RepID=A0A7R8Z4S1_TIMDO|nr:unnamed protein product [Timema douglasi]